MEILKEIPTCLLVKELENRQGVEKIIAEPYQQKPVVVDGPAIVLVVTN